MHFFFVSIIPSEAVRDPVAEEGAAPLRLAVVGASCEPVLYGEDLRAYAYEGDGSSAGSLASTISGETSTRLLNLGLELDPLDSILAPFFSGQREEINNKGSHIFSRIFGILLPNLLWEILLSPLTSPRPHPSSPSPLLALTLSPLCAHTRVTACITKSLYTSLVMFVPGFSKGRLFPL